MSSPLSPALAPVRSREASITRLLIWASLALPWLWGVSHLFPPLNHDVGAVLQWSGRMLAGERLYVDIADVNPPLIYWLNLIPAGLARLTHLPSPLVFTLTLLAAIAASLALARPLFAALMPQGGFAVLVLPALTLFVLMIYPQGSFGQREHLLVILTLPYLLLATARAQSLPVTAGRAALIG